MSDVKQKIKLGDIDFKFPSYYCRYSFDCTNAARKESFKGAACFGTLFGVHKDYKYQGIISIQFCNHLKMIEQKKSNYCPLSDEEIDHFMTYISGLLNFTFEIKMRGF